MLPMLVKTKPTHIIQCLNKLKIFDLASSGNGSSHIYRLFIDPPTYYILFLAYISSPSRSSPTSS